MDMVNIIFRLLVFALTALQSSAEDRVSCFDCTQQKNPYTCNVIRQCGQDENCFSTFYYLDTFPGPLWDFGCQTQSFCRLYGSTSKREMMANEKGISLWNKRDNILRGHQLVMCKKCCQGSFCNRKPCDEDSQKNEPEGIVCHSCTGIRDPSDCKQTTRCGQNEICAVWTLASGLVSLGCKAKTVCDSESKNVGKRGVTSEDVTGGVGNISFIDEWTSVTLEQLKEQSLNGPKETKNLDRRQTVGAGCRHCCSGDLCAASFCLNLYTQPPSPTTFTTVTTTVPTTPTTVTTPTTTVTTPTTTLTTPTTTVTVPTTPTTTLSPLKVKVVPIRVFTFEGDNATFACDVRGQPPLDVEFSRTFDVNQTKSDVHSCACHSSLTIVNKTCSFIDTRLSESGNILCTVTDGQGQIRTSSALLQVEPYKKNLKATIQPTDSDTMVGSRTTIQCSVTGIPPPSVQWLRNVSGSLETLQNGLVFNITTLDSHSVLRISPVPTVHLDGSYVCQANNRLETLNLPFLLQTITPVIAIKPLSNAEVDISLKDISFLCIFNSYPPPSISWGLTTSSNQILSLSQNYSTTASSVTQDRTTTSKIIVALDTLKQNKVKSISCTGDNGYFSNSSQADIKLLESPNITTPAASYQVTWGQFLRLECDADGQPDPYISWNFVDEYDVPQILQGLNIHDDSHVLEVAHVSISGKFTCYASNSIGSDSVTFQVSVV